MSPHAKPLLWRSSCDSVLMFRWAGVRRARVAIRESEVSVRNSYVWLHGV